MPLCWDYSNQSQVGCCATESDCFHERMLVSYNWNVYYVLLSCMECKGMRCLHLKSVIRVAIATLGYQNPLS